MARSMLLILVLVCVAEIKVVAFHDHFRNVAYGKHAIQSSSHPKFPASKAVNGLLSDFSHTEKERSPWLRIDLGRIYEIHQIEIFARKSCCDGRLHDVDVKVGKNVYYMHFCGHFMGPTKAGQRFSVWCPSKTYGRYVQIQIVEGSENILDPAEVAVWGRL
ncbi:fucolectin-7-like [Saccostrea echinata]|uniref:fucolectin-7-like n=1 Tax=Saccostrea echinata TaxID=191078 RepID=UPI002A7FC121|nr:fucolectin-7-like [Saccostrea echinata]